MLPIALPTEISELLPQLVHNIAVYAVIQNQYRVGIYRSSIQRNVATSSNFQVNNFATQKLN